MKIILINDNGTEVGGAETYTVNLRNGLREHGHEVKVITSDFNMGKDTFADYTFKGINVTSPFRIFPYIFNIPAYLKVRQVVKECKPDIVHLQYVFYHSSPSIFLALRDVPTIQTLHSHDLLAPVGLPYLHRCTHSEYEYCMRCMGVVRYLGEKIKRAILFPLLKHVSYFVMPSMYFLKIHKRLHLKNVVHLYNGFKLFNAAPLKNRYRLLFVGRLTREKGVQVLLQALKSAIKTVPQLHLDIIGAGPDEKYFKDMVKSLNIGSHVFFHGKKTNTEIKKYYQESTAVVVPSTGAENLPTVCIEAMSVGRPVLGAHTGGIPELVEDSVTGFVYPSQDAKELSNKIVTLLTDQKLLKTLTENAVKSSKKYSLEKHISAIVKLYEQSTHHW